MTEQTPNELAQMLAWMASNTSEPYAEDLRAAAEALRARPTLDRDAIADEISGVVVGEGYYSTTIGLDAAREAADAILAAVGQDTPEPEWTDGTK